MTRRPLRPTRSDTLFANTKLFLSVILAGVQSRGTLKCLYEHCALFVMPSYHEGLPIAALEAASCGARMLLSDIPANLDIGLDPMNYFPVGDVAELPARLHAECPDFEVAHVPVITEDR